VSLGWDFYIPGILQAPLINLLGTVGVEESYEQQCRASSAYITFTRLCTRRWKEILSLLKRRIGGKVRVRTEGGNCFSGSVR
jgi:hypothetical protein